MDWKKLGEPRNWVKQGVKIGRVTVEKHGDKSVVIHTGRIKGFDINTLLVNAGQIISQVRFILENNFGMILVDEGTLLHEPVTRKKSILVLEEPRHGVELDVRE